MNFINRLNICLKALEVGNELEVGIGTLVWSEEDEGPGFLTTQSFLCDDGLRRFEEQIMQVNSDVAWYQLIEYARLMSEDEATIIAANLALKKEKK